jgi:septal ring factor EnvC (AmiA/AmiB activator)
MKEALFATLLCLCAPSCILFPDGRGEPAAVPVTPGAEVRAVEPEPAPVLYARDGSVVSATAATAEPAPAADAPHEPVRRIGGEGSRMYLLELYQQVIEERDGLRTELEALGSSLAEERATLAAARAEIEDWKARVSTLEADIERSAETNRELAARLVSAQIARLEAEKLLLEAKLSWQAVRDAVTAGEESERTR